MRSDPCRRQQAVRDESTHGSEAVTHGGAGIGRRRITYSFPGKVYLGSFAQGVAVSQSIVKEIARLKPIKGPRQSGEPPFAASVADQRSEDADVGVLWRRGWMLSADSPQMSFARESGHGFLSDGAVLGRSGLAQKPCRYRPPPDCRRPRLARALGVAGEACAAPRRKTEQRGQQCSLVCMNCEARRARRVACRAADRQLCHCGRWQVQFSCRERSAGV